MCGVCVDIIMDRHIFTITHPHPLTMLPPALRPLITHHHHTGTLHLPGDFLLVQGEVDIVIIITHIMGDIMVAMDTTTIHRHIENLYCNTSEIYQLILTPD
jgi:ABC-type uncharacterized transport system permease subunit